MTEWHGGTYTKLYGVWKSMKSRCYHENQNNYINYGGRGIAICEEWRTSFTTFRLWARSNGCKEGLSLDRVDNDGNYEPSNCRFTDACTQNRNKRVSDKSTLPFKGVCLIKQGAAIQANISVYSKTYAKSYSIKKYGYNEALRLALMWRREKEKTLYV